MKKRSTKKNQIREEKAMISAMSFAAGVMIKAEKLQESIALEVLLNLCLMHGLNPEIVTKGFGMGEVAYDSMLSIIKNVESKASQATKSKKKT